MTLLYLRLLGRFAPIFYFNWEHFLFVYIIKQKQTKISRILQEKFRGFSKFSKTEFFQWQIFENSIVHKPSLGSCEIPQKFWPDRFSRFDVIGYKWTDRQPNRQLKFKVQNPPASPYTCNPKSYCIFDVCTV